MNSDPILYLVYYYLYYRLPEVPPHISWTLPLEKSIGANFAVSPTYIARRGWRVVLDARALVLLYCYVFNLQKLTLIIKALW